MCCVRAEQELRLRAITNTAALLSIPPQGSGRRGYKAVVGSVERWDVAGGAFGETGLHLLSFWIGWWLLWQDEADGPVRLALRWKCGRLLRE